MFTSFMQDAVHKMVFVDDHRREIPTSRIRQPQVGRLREINDREAVQRVPVESDDRLFIDAGGCPVVPKTPDTPRDSLNVGKHPVGLRKDEVVDINQNRH